jgi:hypothetical protein
MTHEQRMRRLNWALAFSVAATMTGYIGMIRWPLFAIPQSLLLMSFLIGRSVK